MRPQIVSLGEVLWDLFPDGARFGGAPANFACHAAALGGRVAMASAVGDDDRGREAIEILRAYGIDVEPVQRLPDARTGTVGVRLDAAGKPAFTIHEDAAWDRMGWTPELAERVDRAGVVYFGTLGQRDARSRDTIQRALEAAAVQGVLRLVDINLRAPFYAADLIRTSVEQADILKLSDDELPIVCEALHVSSEDPLIGILEQGNLDLVVMTRGEAGAVLVSPEGVVDQPGVPAEVCDTVGAG
ncbi:MAG: carbohydrate kinase, partial [Verrucomicrobiota bacterium]